LLRDLTMAALFSLIGFWGAGWRREAWLLGLHFRITRFDIPWLLFWFMRSTVYGCRVWGRWSTLIKWNGWSLQLLKWDQNTADGIACHNARSTCWNSLSQTLLINHHLSVLCFSRKYSLLNTESDFVGTQCYALFMLPRMRSESYPGFMWRLIFQS